MIKLGIEELKNELARLDSAIKELESYSTDFITNTIESLEPMNSDFVETLKKTLGNMTDTKAPDFIKKLEEFKINLQEVIKGFEENDNNMANEISSGK